MDGELDMLWRYLCLMVSLSLQQEGRISISELSSSSRHRDGLG